MRRNWTDEENEFLRTSWGKLHEDAIAAKLGRSSSSVRARAQSVGLKVRERNGRGKALRFEDRHGKAWSPQEDRLLRTLWGEFKIRSIMWRLGRRKCALRYRARYLGLGTSRQGMVPLHRLIGDGYHLERLRAAMNALGIKPGPAPSVHAKKGDKPQRWLTDDEAQEVLAYLAKMPDGLRLLSSGEPIYPATQWGVNGRPPSCIVHGGTDVRHAGNGICKRCYDAEWARNKRKKVA